MEYQLHAQQLKPQKFIATAAYGDGGPWYIPTADAFDQGGYEVSVAFAAPQLEVKMRSGLKDLV